ncbi:Mob1/phocein, partial [Gautieria morchelliformis]
MGRPLRGSRLASFYTSDTESDPIAPPSLSTLDSAFQLQEYIGAVVRLNPHDIERIVKVPGRNANADGEEKDKEADGEDERVSVDEACWIYEQLRRLAQDLTHPLITMLQQECTRQTCPEMKAGEWLYLCVAHGNSGAMEHCCAIDYIVHTLDSATALLNSPRAFPSRISIPQTSHRHFPSLARRLGRIFAHAYHHHRLAFESAEAESALYARFLALSRHFDLVPAEFLVIPERNEQGEAD